MRKYRLIVRDDEKRLTEHIVFDTCKKFARMHNSGRFINARIIRVEHIPRADEPPETLAIPVRKEKAKRIYKPLIFK